MNNIVILGTTAFSESTPGIIEHEKVDRVIALSTCRKYVDGKEFCC